MCAELGSSFQSDLGRKVIPENLVFTDPKSTAQLIPPLDFDAAIQIICGNSIAIMAPRKADACRAIPSSALALSKL